MNGTVSSSWISMSLKAAAVLWIIRGVGHVAGGVNFIVVDASSAVSIAADAVDPTTLAADYPDASGAVFNQHGWNLLWGGAFTVVGAVYIWRNSFVAVFMTAIVGGMLDLGYFLFIDLAGYSKFFPGTVMTIISGTAIALSLYAFIRSRPPPSHESRMNHRQM